MPRFDKLLVLDIDETLIHSADSRLDRDPDFMLFDYFVYKRPGVDTFIDTCFDWFEVGFWTSASPEYARGILEELDGTARNATFLWTRERCSYRVDAETRQQYVVKDIRKLVKSGYDVGKIIFVDDRADSLERSYGNAVIVDRYEGARDDDELSALLPFLEVLGQTADIRSVEKRNWRKR